MQIGTAPPLGARRGASLFTIAFVGALGVVACGNGSDAKDPSTSSPPATATDGGTSTTASSSQAASSSCKGKPEIGKAASSFSIPAASGGGTISVPKGKVTIVDFWATWCGPCSESFPKYQDLYVKYKDSGLEIVAVSVDDEDKKKEVASFPKTHGDAKFLVGWDQGHKVADCWQPSKMPSAFIVDKTGVIRFVHEGYGKDEEKKIEKELKSLL